MRICSVEGCDGKHESLGYCGKHYQRQRKTGSTDLQKQARVCSVEGCGRGYKANGLCAVHYNRMRSHGDLDAVRRIKGDDSTRFDSQVELIPFSTCHYWAGSIGHNGYGLFGFSGKHARAHRYAYERAYGLIPEGMLVCHTCDTPSCVNPEHLFLGTHTANMADMRAKDRQARGERSGHAKLSAINVVYIRCSTDSTNDLAVKYDVSRGTVYSALTRKSWKHIA